MSSSNRPLTMMGKQLSTPPASKKLNYRTKSYSSDVDETLFGTPTRFTQQVETKHMSDGKNWDPPWVTHPTKKGAPLLWTPFEYKGFASANKNTITRSRSRPTTPQRSSTKYRMRNHTASFVDETLFGNQLQDPSFRAPWEDNSPLSPRHLLWSPQIIGNSSPLSPRSDASYEDRPKSRLGEYNDPFIPPTPRDKTVSAVTPIIKHRPGSSIKTSHGSSGRHSSNTKNVKLKLDIPERDDEKDELIERALRLAKQAQEASMQQDLPSSRRQAWSKSSLGKSSENSLRHSAGYRSPRLPNFGSKNDDGGPLSATGIRVPLSARSSRTESTDRPSSARARSHSAQRMRSIDSSSSRSWKP